MSYEKYLKDASLVGDHLKKLVEQEAELRATREQLASEATDILLASELTAFEKFLIWKDHILPARYKLWEDVYEEWYDENFYISHYLTPLEDNKELPLLSAKDAGYRKLLAEWNRHRTSNPQELDRYLLSLMKEGKDHVFHS